MPAREEKEAQPDTFLAWKDIVLNTAAWHQESLEYLSEIWPNISSREAVDDTWGDEIECQIVRFDHEAREVRLLLKQRELLEKLPKTGVFQPEFALYMIETTPERPYTSSLSSLLGVEDNLRQRRRQINEQLAEGERLMTFSIFPLLGEVPLVHADDSRSPTLNLDHAVGHGCYRALKVNIEARSNRAVDIKVPVFQDEQMTLPPELQLNDMIFGPGACGLQATFQCETLHEAQVLHDQLVTLGPIFLALTAATPIYQGILVDTDVRWNQTAAAIDDRMQDELDKIEKRWCTASMLLHKTMENSKAYFRWDEVRLDNEDSRYLVSRGLDPIMASYFARRHLRDPLNILTKASNDEEVTPESAHRSLCTSVWPHVRLKVPDVNDPSMGWRVEFRPMEIQLTDFANAAFLVFLNLLVQTARWMGPAFEIWFPFVRTSMDIVHTRDSVLSSVFWVLIDAGAPGGTEDHPNGCYSWSIDTIINGVSGGQRGSFPGLVSLVDKYLDVTTSKADEELRRQINKYLAFVRKRATGEEPTPARWMRDSIQSHEKYEKDSVVTSEICYEMLVEIEKMDKRETDRS